MLDFQNKALDSKLLKFHANRDNQAYLEKCDFQRKLVYQIWDCHWIRGIETSSRVVSDSESYLVLHAKRNKVKLTFLTVRLEKREFLQMTPNIDILSTVGKYFSPQIRIWDRYLKMKLYLARIHWQSLSFLHANACQGSGHFHQERRVTLWWRGQEDPVGTMNHRWGWLEMAVQRWEATA